MDLHRTSGQPDWAAIAPARRNYWQRLGARTNGVVTPGNVITVCGLLLVLIGLICILCHAYWWGFMLIVIGRSGDILDGLAAAATSTKSPLGEALDVACDKAGSLAAFGTLVLAHIISLFVAGLLLLPALAIIGLTALAARWRVKLHPSRPGKLSMAVTWGALGCFLLAAALKLTGHAWLRLIGDFCAAAAFVLGTVASGNYLRDIRSAGP